MKYLITNSDDFGLTPSITDAIIDTHLHGIMSSTTILANMSGTDYAIEKAKEIVTLSVGVHFNLTEGKPLTEPHKIPLLLNDRGEFKENSQQRINLIFGRDKQKQAELELSNQLSYVLDNGLRPTHFDSHHHITGTPVAFRASMNVARRFNIFKARITNINYVYTEDYNEGIFARFIRFNRQLPKSLLHRTNKIKLRLNRFETPDTKILPSRVLPIHADPVCQFIKTLSALREGVTEISFHPGYLNSNLNDSDMTAALRLRDLKVAKSEVVREYIKKNDIQLISFKDI